MKISYRWLARHVDLVGLTAQEVANDLTIHTAEVEGLERFAPQLSDVVVGHVVERAKHPDADKLSLCKVDVGPRGEGQLVQIVCGAANVAQGQRVAVALPGVTLPGELKIKKSKIRGVESQGMICSERELALSDEHAGIWVLPGTPAPGTSVAQALGLDDWIIEIDNKSLTHRPDLWGHRGLALEVAAIRGRKRKALELAFPKTGSGKPYPVRVESAGCARYLGLEIEGVKNGPSPDWLRFLLLAVGQRPIDLLVDLSNFVMLDLAQPNHLFDRARLGSSGILVRNARAGETTKTLDGVERALSADDMLICSGDEVVAIAGVMGGEASKVTGETSALLLEAACFHPTTVRRTAARLGLRTDASARFEKNLDPTLPAKAAAHLVNLLRELQPGITLPRPAGDAGQWQDPARAIALRPARVREVLGAPLADERVEGYLTALEFGVNKSGASWSVSVPSARATKDIRIEEDLIEEIGRLFGYGNIADAPLVAPLAPAPFDERRELVRALQDRLSGAAGFHEAMTYSFHESAHAERVGIADQPHVRIVNPQIEGLDRVRRSVAPSLLAHLAHNRRQGPEVRLFEIGKGYLPERGNARGEPLERHECALAWLAPRPAKGARFDAGVFAHLQGVVEDALAAVGRPVSRWERCADAARPAWAHPTRCVVAHGALSDGKGEPVGEPLALLATLEPEIQSRLELTGELDGEVACASLWLDALLAAPAVPPRFHALPRFPSVKVDVAVAVAEGVAAGALVSALQNAGKGLVESCELFDLYRGPNLGAGKKSLAFHVLLQAAERTLSDQDCAKYLARVERAVVELGGELRKE
ncbi:MAG: phenylalanine--tRNA ligase subunit beta [Planctomycetes bacterium]|nr:phenylalanine--tRNA ligase subunit beta [Planctomycetota bacterium]